MTLSPPEGRFDGSDFLFPIRVYYEDTDLSGYVYHGTYVAFFERGRSEALRAAGLTHSYLLTLDPPAVMVVRHMQIDFLRPALIDDALVVRSVMEEARGARMVIRQQIERDGEVLARAHLEAALITMNGGPRRFPPDVMEKLRAWIKPSTP